MTETTVTYRYGPPFPLKDLTVYALFPHIHIQELIHFLQAHQIQVAKPDGSTSYNNGQHDGIPNDGYLDDYYVLTFPEGTIEQRLFPIIESDRFLLTLPNGMILFSLYNPYENMRYAVPVYAIGP